jgi:four helix bundle protein
MGEIVNRGSLHRESASKQSPQISRFQDLEVYQVAREFRKGRDRAAKHLPDEEKFGLSSQIRRAALSLTNKITGGHGRFHYPDQIKVTLQSRGSLEELMDDLKMCDGDQYVPNADIATLKQQGWRVRQLIGGYIRYLRQQMNSGTSRRKEEEEVAYGDAAGDSRFSM